MKIIGLGKETKSKIFWRHVIIILLFFVFNIYLVYAILLRITCIRSTEEICDYIELDSWYAIIMASLFYSQGFILVFVRMLEPGSLSIHRDLMRELFNCRNSEPKESCCIAPINMLFNSTMNIELVYVILEGLV